MKRFFSILFIIALSLITYSQTADTINKTDVNGLRQGYWTKYYPDGTKQYDGFFKNDNPVGEFRRYYEDGAIKSLTLHKEGKTEILVRFFHPNGFVAAEGFYVNQKKEGKWSIYSQKTSNYLICEEFYENDLRNGSSVKYYKDGTIAEKVNYVNDVREGDWTQYYVTGKICLKAHYINDKLDGPFEVVYANGEPEYIGQYKENVRDGEWKVFSEEGKLSHTMKYKMGTPDDPEMAVRENAFLDMLEKNKGKLSDPEITGTIWNY